LTFSLAVFASVAPASMLLSTISALWGSTSSADRAFPRVVEIATIAANIVISSTLGGDVAVFVTAEALFDSATSVVFLNRMCLVRP
jgi:hypothetical protein